MGEGCSADTVHRNKIVVMSRRSSSSSSITSSVSGDIKRRFEAGSAKNVGSASQRELPFLLLNKNDDVATRFHKQSNADTKFDVKSSKKKRRDEDESVLTKMHRFNRLAKKEEKPVPLLSASADPV